MKDLSKYEGIFPAFYACYDHDGKISAPAVRALAKFLLDKGVQGLYVGGSSGECIYQSVAERKETLENVMAEVGGKLTIIAHVACNNTGDSRELAAHAESLGVDAISMTGFQSGFITNDVHSKAFIKEINTQRLEQYLAEGKVVVAAGF